MTPQEGKSGPAGRRTRRIGRSLAVAAAGLVLVQCDRPEPAPVAEAPPPPPPASSPPPLPKPAAITRADLIRAIAAAASAYAAGEPPAEAGLAGRPFAVRSPFGCFGPQPAPKGDEADGLARWDWAKDGKSIRLSLTLADWTKARFVAREGETAPWDMVEGAWEPRPWLASETCPRSQTQTGDAIVVSPQTVGLAVVHEAGGSRLERRNGRPYTFTIKGEGGETARAPLKGYRLLLEGRIGAFPDGQPIRCHADGPNERPVCVAAVKLDKVAFEDGETGMVLSEWAPG